MPNSNPQIIHFRSPAETKYNAAADLEQNFLGRRIAEARKNAGLSLVRFSSLLEEYGVFVTAGAINKWEVGKNIPSAYQLIAVSQALQMDVELSRLMSIGKLPELNEEGQKKVAAYKADLIASGRYKPQSTKAIKYIEMPVSNLAVSAGTGEFLEDGNFEMVRFPESTVPAGADFGLRVSGDSMEPVYHDGQIVWVQQCEQVGIGEVGIFIYDGEGYIKVYHEQEPCSAEIEDFTDSYDHVHMQPVMISYNQNYPPREISAHVGFQIVGRVL